RAASTGAARYQNRLCRTNPTGNIQVVVRVRSRNPHRAGPNGQCFDARCSKIPKRDALRRRQGKPIGADIHRWRALYLPHVINLRLCHKLPERNEEYPTVHMVPSAYSRSPVTGMLGAKNVMSDPDRV